MPSSSFEIIICKLYSKFIELYKVYVLKYIKEMKTFNIIFNNDVSDISNISISNKYNKHYFVSGQKYYFSHIGINVIIDKINYYIN